MAATLDVIIADKPGQHVTVPYKDTQPIFFLLERIRSQLGTKEEDIGRQDLYINGRRLEDLQQTIAYYRIFGRTLTYKDRPKNNIVVTIKKLSGASVTMEVHSSMRVSEFKEMFHRKERIPVDQCRFIFAGKQLEDQLQLCEYNIQKDCVIHLVLRLRGGGMAPGLVFSDVSDTSNVRKVQFSMTAPPGRVAAPGTNVECKCACTPSHHVICIKQFGVLELSEESFICPNCYKSHKISPVTVGFMKCRYRFHGIKATGEQYTSDWKDVTDDDCYQLFNPDKSTTWRRLMIESTNASDCDECSICLERLRTFDTLGCGHKFHSNCISAWSGSCPNCRFNQHLTTGRAA
ncbi:hypothetical protein F5H01DRAFT_354017 [Linnemannia elongata]|nr:hypothetical protein F5H01DRAFT_354017 [Linnemannia elongata]